MDSTKVIKAVQGTVKLMENAPVLVNGVNHIVTHGVKQGGYDLLTSAWNGIAQNSTSLTTTKDIGTAAYQGLQNTFQGSGNLIKDVTSLGQNMKSRFAEYSKPTLAKGITKIGDMLNHGIIKTASEGATAVLSSVGSATAKDGIAGIAIGVTTETIELYEKYKNGELSKEEYLKEIAKLGAQMGITGAATAGIITAIQVPLAAAPITIPISIVLGAGINKIVAPIFGRGDYQKILGEAKYYQNMMYAHDDLVHAIEMTENQFCEFINEYERKMQLHAQLTNTNNQLKQSHTVADIQIQQQANQIHDTFDKLGDLYNKI